MAYFTLYVCAPVAACLAIYIFLFVGRRGRHFPGGKSSSEPDILASPSWRIANSIEKVLPLYRSLETCINFQSRKPFSSEYQSSIYKDLSEVCARFTDWAKQYGGLYTLKLGPGTVAVLTDRRIIKQLMDKRSAVSSNRPTSLVAQQLITEGDHMLWMDNTPAWRLMRKLIHQDLTESLCNREHSKIQQAEVTQMLFDMMQSPDEWSNHLKRFSNSVIMSIGKPDHHHCHPLKLTVCQAFGIRSPSIDAKHTRILSDIVELWARINEFGATPPVDIFPFLKLVPERFLGNWVTRAKVVHDALHDLYDNLMSSVIRRRGVMGSTGSMMDRLLDGQEKTGLTSHQIAFICGVTIKGGSDTSASALTSTMQALITWPEVLKKAQAEMDAVVGEDRLPTWDDYGRLPYTAAMVKETHRWRPVAPLGVPHALSEGTSTRLVSKRKSH